ncbi:hypothetical protein, partial [Helicobacter sp. T3_23-1056]
MKNTRTNTMASKQVALSNSAKTRERERERESNSALNLSSSKSSNCKTYKETSVIVGNDSTSVIVSKDSAFVIASKSQDLRGNLHFNIDKVDCHANAVAFARNDTHHQTPSAREGVYLDCHADFYKSARNDGIISPSLAEGAKGWVSLDSTADIISKDSTSVIASKKSVSEFLRGNLYPQSAKHAFDKHNKIDCHDSTLRAESRNDKKATPTPKKRLALSLATSAILASISIDTAVAWCGVGGSGGTFYKSNTLLCYGSENVAQLARYTNTNSANGWWGGAGAAIYYLDLGTGSQRLNISGGGTPIKMENQLRTVRIGNVNAGSLTLQATLSGSNLQSTGTANISSLILNTANGGGWNSIHIGNSSNIGSLTLPTSATTLI